MVLVGLFDPDAILGLIVSERATVILGVPTMVVVLLDSYGARPRDGYLAGDFAALS